MAYGSPEQLTNGYHGYPKIYGLEMVTGDDWWLHFKMAIFAIYVKFLLCNLFIICLFFCMVLLMNLHFPLAMLGCECTTTYWYVMSQNKGESQHPLETTQQLRMKPLDLGPFGYIHLTSILLGCTSWVCADLGCLPWALEIMVWKKSFPIWQFFVSTLPSSTLK